MSTTTRQLLEAAALTSPTAQAELDQLPVLPELARPVWRLFTTLAKRRQSGMSANPLTYQEVLAFCELTHQPLSPLEVELVMELDDTWQQYHYYSTAKVEEQQVIEKQWDDWMEDDDG